MRVIIPWSGGIDSTALLMKALNEGHIVRTFSCEFDVGPHVNVMQARARSVIRRILHDLFPGADWLHFDQPHVLKIRTAPNEGFTQIGAILLASMHHVCADVETQIWLGFHGHDELVKVHGEVLPFKLREAAMGIAQLMLKQEAFENMYRNLKIFTPFSQNVKKTGFGTLPQAVADACWCCTEPLETYGKMMHVIETCEQCDGCKEDPRLDC